MNVILNYNSKEKDGIYTLESNREIKKNLHYLKF